MVKKKEEWPLEAKELAIKLHATLVLNSDNWHRLKSNHERRAAEQLASAMVQLISGGNLLDVDAQMKQGIKWLNNEISDPGCPRH